MLITVHCSFTHKTVNSTSTRHCRMHYKSKEYTSTLGQNVSHRYLKINGRRYILSRELNSIKRNHGQPAGILHAYVDLLNSCCIWWLASSCESYYYSTSGQVNFLGGLACQINTSVTSTLLLLLQQLQQAY